VIINATANALAIANADADASATKAHYDRLLQRENL